MQDLQTYEIRISFANPQATGIKPQLLRWLAQHGYDSVVEAVVDGVEVEASAEAEAEVAMADEHLPAAVFVEGKAAAVELIGRLTQAFADNIALRMDKLDDAAWQSAWASEWRAFASACFWVHPQLEPGERPAGLMPLAVKAGEAFGNGQHAATQVILEALENVAAMVAPRATAASMLDIGTGTGILAIAAAKLGFRPVVATDTDVAIIDEAAANCALNACSVQLVVTDTVPAGAYDVICANILVPVLHGLMGPMARGLAPGGVLLLSGFIDKDVPMLMHTARQHGLTLNARQECRSWVCLHLRRGEVVDAKN